MMYVLLLDPYDNTFAVMLDTGSNLYHLSLSWAYTEAVALRRFLELPHGDPISILDTPLVDRVQIISKFTIESHPEAFI